MSQQANSSAPSGTMPDHLWSAGVTILNRLFPRTSGVIAMWKAIVDYPVLLCPCEDGQWCEWCEPTPWGHLIEQTSVRKPGSVSANSRAN